MRAYILWMVIQEGYLWLTSRFTCILPIECILMKAKLRMKISLTVESPWNPQRLSTLFQKLPWIKLARKIFECDELWSCQLHQCFSQFTHCNIIMLNIICIHILLLPADAGVLSVEGVGRIGEVIIPIIKFTHNNSYTCINVCTKHYAII